MAIHDKPHIVTNGLQWCLDAANSKSYPGTGIIWTDLTGNNNGTLSNITFSGANNGGMIFNGTSSNVDTNSKFSSIITGTASFTIELWVNPNSTQVNYVEVFANFDNIIPAGSGIQGTTTSNQYQFAYGDGASWYFASVFSLTPQIFNHLIITKNASYVSTYINGNLIYYDNLTASISSNSSFNFKIGSWYSGGGRFFSGNIPVAKIYNRELSALEVQQNYNALKGRFGL